MSFESLDLRTTGNKFMLTKPVDIKGFTVPAGFETDFATIPRWALSFMGRPTRASYQIPSLLHDYLLVSELTSAQKAHELFHESLLEHGIRKFKAYIMYMAVKYFRKLRNLR